MKILLLVFFALFLFGTSNAQTYSSNSKVKNSNKPEAEGLYALWYQNSENPLLYLNQPYINGGQMVFQW